MTQVIDLDDFRTLASCSTGPVAPGYLQHVQKINDVFLDQIKSCDQKAAYVFTIMLAFLATSSGDKAAFTVLQGASILSVDLLIPISLMVASSLSFVAAVLVVLPRHVSRSTTLFWGCWLQNRDRLCRAAIENDQAYLFAQYVENAEVLAMIAARKHRLVRLALRSLLVAALCYVASRCPLMWPLWASFGSRSSN